MTSGTSDEEVMRQVDAIIHTARELKLSLKLSSAPMYELIDGRNVVLVTDSSGTAARWLKFIAMTLTSVGFEISYSDRRSWFDVQGLPYWARKAERRKASCYAVSAHFPSNLIGLKADVVHTQPGAQTAKSWARIYDELLPNVAPIVDGHLSGW